MEIIFGSNKIRRSCNNASGRLKTRLDDIIAAENMGILKFLPGKLHALKGNRKGQWALDLEQPKRLCFEPIADPLPISKDGFLSLSEVYAIKIVYIGDYHGK
ncbi:MAG: killer suppression protein HigA [FCB group bacterium]|nr:killer suppression protein HigA [FCB group bacterium]